MVVWLLELAELAVQALAVAVLDRGEEGELSRCMKAVEPLEPRRREEAGR